MTAHRLDSQTPECLHHGLSLPNIAVSSVSLSLNGPETGAPAASPARPAQEVRSLIRGGVKREELARLKPLLRQAREDTLTSDVSTQGRLTDLLTYQDRVESTPEWPFDSSTLLRFGIYLLIPVGSMVGGALVERIVDMVLD